MNVGEKASDFTLESNNGPLKLSTLKGKNVVLYFYPKDDTSGCTLEAQDFTAQSKEFEKRNTVVLGVSPDTVESHCNFIKKHSLSVKLLADPEKKVLQQYGVWQEKSMYGRKYMGVVRTTYLIDPKGNIKHVWEKVTVPGHVEEVLKKIQQ